MIRSKTFEEEQQIMRLQNQNKTLLWSDTLLSKNNNDNIIRILQPLLDYSSVSNTYLDTISDITPIIHVLGKTTKNQYFKYKNETEELIIRTYLTSSKQYCFLTISKQNLDFFFQNFIKKIDEPPELTIGLKKIKGIKKASTHLINHQDFQDTIENNQNMPLIQQYGFRRRNGQIFLFHGQKKILSFFCAKRIFRKKDKTEANWFSHPLYMNHILK